ncbi:MAG: protein-L-isoaspartate(D-aspartate) O-methyltransferase [Synergistaceae bacterium]|jgi:protein-L-isoaspartate(D-aspartate) O-methyltransferase|nr:protein-L-isoaspartate(D-aspartate) O-methyltransferase [Synergistaceae bacterium]
MGDRETQNWYLQASDMVEEQIVGRDVKDARVLDAMTSVLRHLFVLKEYKESAYIDRPLPIGERQTISQPYMVAKMTELLSTEPGMKVLEVGTGSGYQSAVLAAMGLRVWSVERIESLANQARERLRNLQFDVAVIHGDGRDGYPSEAPYDRIIVTAASSRVESSWDQQLLPNGRLVVPLSVMTGGQRLLVRENLERGFRNTWYDYCRFVPLLMGID